MCVYVMGVFMFVWTYPVLYNTFSQKKKIAITNNTAEWGVEVCPCLYETETFPLLFFYKMEVYLAIVIAYNITWVLHALNHHEQS